MPENDRLDSCCEFIGAESSGSERETSEGARSPIDGLTAARRSLSAGHAAGLGLTRRETGSSRGARRRRGGGAEAAR